MSAAKQGLTAHISQASEDAKRMSIRALPTTLQRHPFLSNLNTTCTIKSAPPRTPECMTRLATKSGWLYKRNESNKWQRRWCCVVPHTFLYYFDSEPSAGDDDVENYYNVRDADDYATVLNEIDESEEKFSADGAAASVTSGWCAQDTPATSPAPVVAPKSVGYSSAPVGIIDLDCYTGVNREVDIQPVLSSIDGSHFLMELAPDAKINPNLRSFYFQADTSNEVLDWTRALLFDRFYMVRDEKDAYKQITDSFPIQLANLNNLINEADQGKKDAEAQIYNIRSITEESKRELYDKIANVLESLGGNQLLKELSSRMHDDQGVHMNNASLLSGGVQQALDILISHALLVKQEKAEMAGELQSMKENLSVGNTEANEELDRVKLQISQTKEEHKLQTKRFNERIFALEKLLEKSRLDNESKMREIEAKSMEFGIYKASSKSKLQELSQHKKILKNEVLELRKQLNTVTSELNKEKLQTEKAKLELDTQKERNRWKDEQLKTQSRNFDTMIETMSLGSYSQSHQYSHQHIKAHVDSHNGTMNSINNRVDPNRPPRPQSKRTDIETEHDDADSDSAYSEYSRGNMSELTTEDISHACLSTKTPKSGISNTSEYETNQRLQTYNERQSHIYPIERSESAPVLQKNDRRETSSVNVRNDRGVRSDRSVQSSASMKLSIAQRARLEADKPSRSVSVTKKKSVSMFDKFGDKVTSIIDNSPLGVKVADPSAPTPVGPMSLAEREKRQRESQLKFLMKEGIINEDADLSTVMSGSSTGIKNIGRSKTP